jgi:chitin synthase
MGSGLSQQGHGSQGRPSMSQYGNQVPQLGGLPFMPFSGAGGLGGGSVHGSEYGGMAQPGFGQPNPMFGMGGMGMGPGAPRNTVMTNLNMFSGSAPGTNASQSGFAPPSAPFAMQQQRPMSTFSMATSVNPFAGPSMNPDPSDEELFNALRNYLSTQDLMTVTKK